MPGLDPRRADLIVSGARAARHGAAAARGERDHAVRFRAARRARARLHPAQPASTSRRPANTRTCGAAASSSWPSGAATGPSTRNQVARLSLSIFDQTRSAARADRSRARMARVCGAAARHRHAHQLSAPSQALVLPHQERRSARVRAGGSRDRSRSSRAITASRAPKKSHSDFGALEREEAQGRAHAVPRSCGWPKRSTAATRRRSRGVELHDRGDEYLVKLRTTGDAELELWAAHRQIAPLERALGKPIRLSAGRASYAEQPEHAARIPGEAVRGRRHRRVGKDDAAGAAGQVAERRRPARVRDRVELVGAGEGGDENGEEKEFPDADDLQFATRH